MNDTTDQTVLVVGASGPNAGTVVPALVARGARVRALVREDEGGETARSRGAVEVAVGDLTDPESLRIACDGVDAVFHVNPAFAPEEAQMGLNMVEAAQAVHVRKLVFWSVYHPALPLTNHTAKQPVEAALYDSGLTYAVLQPSMFMQNLAGSWDEAVSSGKLVMPFSVRARLSYVDLRDLAEAVAIALTTDHLDYGTFELSSPGMVDRNDLANMMSEASGRTIEAGEITVDEWLAQVHMPEGALRDGLAAMYRHYDAHGFSGGNSLVLETILGHRPRTLADYFHELASAA